MKDQVQDARTIARASDTFRASAILQRPADEHEPTETDRTPGTEEERHAGNASALLQSKHSRKSAQASASTSGSSSANGKGISPGQTNFDVADKLIGVFSGKTPEEWRKLIAFSKHWPTLADR
jgi:hypothetical protein